MDTVNRFSVAGGIAGSMLAFSSPFSRRMPVLYGVILTGASGYFVGHMLYQTLKESRRREKMYLEEYIRNHKEDFPDPPQVKYGDLLLPWKPNR